MPCPTIRCEFCSQPFRKDRYGIHVKSKHIRELAQQFLEDSGNSFFNPIKSITKGYNPQNIPVYSRRDDGAVYFFGVVPRYFHKDDSYGTYINNEENMKKHEQFLKEVIDTIPLTEYMYQIQKKENRVPVSNCFRFESIRPILPA
jgi:hypothetical protein